MGGSSLNYLFFVLSFQVASGYDYFTLNSGSCTVSSSCFYSPNYASNYNNGDSCSITVNLPSSVSGSVTADAFATESCCDFLTIDGTSYSGTSGPSSRQVQDGDTITFTSDSFVTNSGFSVCFAEGDATDSTSFEVLTGACTVDGSNCVYSPNYPSSYNNNDYCEIEVLVETKLERQYFYTESSFDYLSFNGVSYSGTSAPKYVQLEEGDEITFDSDGSVVYSGFKYCPAHSSNDSSISGATIGIIIGAVLGGLCIICLIGKFMCAPPPPPPPPSRNVQLTSTTTTTTGNVAQATVTRSEVPMAVVTTIPSNNMTVNVVPSNTNTGQHGQANQSTEPPIITASVVSITPARAYDL
eukprot:CAMPEP_0114347272 /NCGR_PEP_ID=MMETSP0101-20121206/13770_1 /TAXON_ID=38822 ORGANISM="Pteridomonas danica, Strain PT" /NCGR_SAMPLE_ID=MMETSP0101 /ASSEMBLY_ACC=CAM_ASM_000211 /LENGTH=354 /DNA_ID=CAMNT_0001484487 /DNA_START=76 /DNA_END=1140 /DNA_ORIENTATION=-